jgi:hypothetical protein
VTVLVARHPVKHVLTMSRSSSGPYGGHRWSETSGSSPAIIVSSRVDLMAWYTCGLCSQRRTELDVSSHLGREDRP